MSQWTCLPVNSLEDDLMLEGESFSRRMGYSASPPITIWDDAPENFRYGILRVASDDLETSPDSLREIVCKVLRTRPDPTNWSPYPNIWNEVESLAMRCEWFKFYDVVEAIAASIREKRVRFNGNYFSGQQRFDALASELMADLGMGWKLKDGVFQVRGEESYEAHLTLAMTTLTETNRPTAITELKEAIRDISRRPVPDNSGAIQHAMAGLECVARDIANDPKPTLGTLIKNHPDLIPKPVDVAIEKLWGYASEIARHGREGNEPTREEAMLTVGIAATLVNYLVHKTA